MNITAAFIILLLTILLQRWFSLEVCQRYCSILSLIFWWYSRCNEYLPGGLPWSQHIENYLRLPILFTNGLFKHLTVLWYFDISHLGRVWCLQRRIIHTFLIYPAFLNLLFQHTNHHFLDWFCLNWQLLRIIHRWRFPRRHIIELQRGQSWPEVRQLVVSWLCVEWVCDTTYNLIIHSRWRQIVVSNPIYVDSCDLCHILILDLLIHRNAFFRLHSKSTFLVTILDDILFLRRRSCLFIDLNFDLTLSELIGSYRRFFRLNFFLWFIKLLTLISLQLLINWA